jgi:glycosyltransferase involved in cell wall biosynthesis
MIAKPKLLFISSYPPRECGIATFTKDTITAINKTFRSNFEIVVAALNASDTENRSYDTNVVFEVGRNVESYLELASYINADETIKLVVLQHEFGLFAGEYGSDILKLTTTIDKPYAVVFHTILPKPEQRMQAVMFSLIDKSALAIVMTEHAKKTLQDTYHVPEETIKVIPHGFHLTPSIHPDKLKEKYNCKNKTVLCTFGLISRDKGIDIALKALSSVQNKDAILYLVAGKTHPEVLRHEGEKYRLQLEELVCKYGLEDNVRFINRFLELDELLEYLHMTDIYLFTSQNPQQAISGTLTYALGARCAVLTTPISHAQEIIENGIAIPYEFDNSCDLAAKIDLLTENKSLRNELSINAYVHSRKGIWENVAILYAEVFRKLLDIDDRLFYSIPPFSLTHFVNITDDIGMYQFTNLEYPNEDHGYTLDDNARALYVLMKYRALNHSNKHYANLERTFLNFIGNCQQEDGQFLNYLDKNGEFTAQNNEINTDEATSRAILGIAEVICTSSSLYRSKEDAKLILNRFKVHLRSIESPRALGKLIKALYNLTIYNNEFCFIDDINVFADHLCALYESTKTELWYWFENNLSYSNSDIPEGLFYAFKITGNARYKHIAIESLEFLIDKMYNNGRIDPISHRSKITKHHVNYLDPYGQQPVEVASIIECLEIAYDVTKNKRYYNLLLCSFTWFLGNNILSEIVYNPATGGGHDGIEKQGINLNQGAESTLSYLVSYLVVERLFQQQKTTKQVV